jgi:hypothetical protein
MSGSHPFARFALLLCALSSLALARQQEPAGFTISGTVVEHATNRPLGSVLVILSPTTARDRQVTVVTAGDGRFTFTNLPAAKYSLLAQRRGQRDVQGYQGTEGFSTGVVAGPGQVSENLVFALDAPASISGIVVDEDGDPVRQANVVLLRKSVSFGESQVNQMDQKTVGSSGRFRFAHLSPGTYYIAVLAQPWYAQQVQPGVPGAEIARDLDVAYPITYYGDTTNGAAAAPILLAEGASLSVQINIRAVAAIHVPIVGIDTSRGGMNANVFVEGPGGFLLSVSAPLMGVNNLYELTGLAPGRYIAEFQDFRHHEALVTARQTVDLAAGSTLSMQSAAPISVTGQVVFEGLDRPPKGVGVLLSDGKQFFRAGVRQDGSFDFGSRAPVPGRYEVYVSSAGEAYVKSVAAKGAAISGGTIEIAEGASIQLSVVAAKGAHSKLDGIALKDDKPLAAAMILLLPQDLNRKLLIRRDQSDSDGTFTLPEIVPGRYTLLAIDDGRELAYHDPDAIKPYLSGGQLVEFPRKSDAPVKVNVVSRQRRE